MDTSITEAPGSVTAEEIQVKSALIGMKMWLTAGTAVSLSFSQGITRQQRTIPVRGFILQACLGPQADWARLSRESRLSLERETLVASGAALTQALATAVSAIKVFVASCEAEGLAPSMRRLREQWARGNQDLNLLPSNLAETLEELRDLKQQQVRAAQIGSSVKLSEYPDSFSARTRERKLIAVLGPTNSGKTYDAFQRLATCDSGVYLGPLRLLALEAYTRLNDEFGIRASLLTGEERRMVEGSKVVASTIEMLDPNAEVEVAVIDEIQMLSDPDRGWAWTQAVVGANASEVWLLGALSAEPAIKALAKRLGVPLEIRRKQRKHPLVIGEPLSIVASKALQKAKKGDAFIVFSRRDALNLRDDLLTLSKTVACIYGALSPEVREREARRFAEGDADILVATDAIGMGLNLPISRIVMTAVQKFDGISRGEVSIPLMQQIGGRAGRFGHQEEAGVVAGLTPEEHKVVARLMKEKQLPLPSSGFQIAAGSAYLGKLAEASGDTRLEVLLSLFLVNADCGDDFFKPHVPAEQLTRAATLDKMRNLTLEQKSIFSMAPMASQHEVLDDTWLTWARMVNQGKTIPVSFLEKESDIATLEEAETAVRLLAAYRWFAYRMPEYFIEHEKADENLEPWTEAVDQHLRSKRKQGAGGGKSGAPSWYWPAR